MFVNDKKSWTGFASIRIICMIAIVVAGLLMQSQAAHARVRLDDICSIQGQKEVKLVGMGLVVGLAGTGDGGNNLPAMRALAAAMKLLNAPVISLDELRNADNVAIVMVEASVPKTGLRRGQKLDCYVSSFMGAESLRGGRLLVTPVETSDVRDSTAVGLASGPIYVEDPNNPLTGRIPGGIVLEEDFVLPFLSDASSHSISLLLDAAHSSFSAASRVAHAINDEFSFETEEADVALPVGPGLIEVRIPEHHRPAVVEFVAQVLDVVVDEPSTQAKVIVNAKSGVVLISGEVVISPVIISHKNLTVEVGAAPGGPTNGPFVPIQDPQSAQTTQLDDLIAALNELRVSTDDIVSIVRELHRSGKLHAAYEEY